MPVYDAVVGLGANLGDREATLRQAIRNISGLGRIAAVSALYETEPVGPPQPKYLNAALRLATELTPEALLDELLSIELLHGRVRRERWGPRVLDLDVLWVAGLEVRTPRLCVPHPELEHRAFALVPLVDVAPDAMSPRGDLYRAVSMTLDHSGMVELPGSRGRWAELSDGEPRGA